MEWKGRSHGEEQAVSRDSLSELLALDRMAFNADRSKLIEALIRGASFRRFW
jgi:hypothetical protein